MGMDRLALAEHGRNVAKHIIRNRQVHVSRRLSSVPSGLDRRADSGGQVVAMMQTAEPRHGYDLVIHRNLRRRSMRPVY